MSFKFNISKPIVLDLFCCAGLAAEGYIRAGFQCIGIDNKPPSSYPGLFFKSDWRTGFRSLAPLADVIHASPPCQEYSRLKAFTHVTGSDFLPDVVQALQASGKPYIIENVTSAPLPNPFTLTGTMFGLPILKKRAFASNVLIFVPPRTKERSINPITVAGHVFSAPLVRKLYNILRPITRHEIAEGIPPHYTHFIGNQLMTYLTKQNTCSERV
ncbi:MAG: DNA cytosine methyltransferase [Saprospiraceae bacterium]